LDLLTANYVFPDRAQEIAGHVRARMADGAYDDLTAQALCDAVTTDLQTLHQDRHLRMAWHDEAREEVADQTEAEVAMLADWRQEQRLSGGGITQVRLLTGNVGLIEMSLVGSPDLVGALYAGAMRQLSDTHALILDMRLNRGGEPDGAALFCSYFFDDEPVLLNEIYDGTTGKTRQMWSFPVVEGPRYLDRPVYLLTGAKTFSGGEDISYTLQQHGKVTVIGQTSRGGAHPTQPFLVSPHLDIRIPIGRTVNPISGTNWEGVGVVPDHEVPEADALTVAHRRALEHVVTLPADSEPAREVRKEAEQTLADTV